MTANDVYVDVPGGGGLGFRGVGAIQGRTLSPVLFWLPFSKCTF